MFEGDERCPAFFLERDFDRRLEIGVVDEVAIELPGEHQAAGG